MLTIKIKAPTEGWNDEVPPEEFWGDVIQPEAPAEAPAGARIETSNKASDEPWTKSSAKAQTTANRAADGSSTKGSARAQATANKASDGSSTKGSARAQAAANKASDGSSTQGSAKAQTTAIKASDGSSTKGSSKAQTTAAEHCEKLFSRDGKPDAKVLPNHPCFDPLTFTEEMLNTWPLKQPKPLKDTPCKLIMFEKDLKLAVVYLKIAKQIGVSLVLDHLSYHGRVCYISLSTEDTDYIVDVIALSTHVKLLAPVFLDKGIVKVMYGSEEGSLYWLQQKLELFVANLFELQQGMLRLEKQKNRTLREILTSDYGVSFSIEKYDFKLRPLTQSAGDYIRAQSHFLIYLYKKIRNNIIRTHGQKSYMNIANKINALCFVEKPHPNVLNDQHVIDQLRKTQEGQRKMMEELHAWREKVACEHNIDVEEVLKQASLHALVFIMPDPAFVMHSSEGSPYVRKDIVTVSCIVGSNRCYSDGVKKLQTMMANQLPTKDKARVWRQMHKNPGAPFKFVTALTAGRKLKNLTCKQKRNAKMVQELALQGLVKVDNVPKVSLSQHRVWRASAATGGEVDSSKAVRKSYSAVRNPDGSISYRLESLTRSSGPGAGVKAAMTCHSGDQYSSSKNARNDDSGNAPRRGFMPEDEIESRYSRASRTDGDDGRDGDRRRRYDSPPSNRRSQSDSRMDPSQFSSSSRVESQYAQSRRERSPYMYQEQSPPRGSREESHQHDTAPINPASQYSSRHAMQFNQPKEDLRFEPPNRGRPPPLDSGRGGPSLSFSGAPRDDNPPYGGPSTVDEMIGKGVSYPGAISRDFSPVSRQNYAVRTSEIYSREDSPPQTYPTIRREGPPSIYPIRSKQDSPPQTYPISARRDPSPTYANRPREHSPPQTYPIRPREDPLAVYPIRSREDSPPQTYPIRRKEDLSPTHPIGSKEGPMSTYPIRSREDSPPQTYPVRPRRGPSPTYPIGSREDSPPQIYPIRPREDSSPTYPIRPTEGPLPAYPNRSREDSPQETYPIRPRKSPSPTYPMRPREVPSPTYPVRSREDSPPQTYPIRPREDPSSTYPIRPREGSSTEYQTRFREVFPAQAYPIGSRRSPSPTYLIRPREDPSPAYPTGSREDSPLQTYPIRPREDPSSMYPIRSREDSPPQLYPVRHREDSSPTYPIRSRGNSPPQDYHISRREDPPHVHSKRPRDDSPPAHSQTYIIQSREDSPPQTYSISPRENPHVEIPSRSTSHYSKRHRANASPDPSPSHSKRSRGSPSPHHALSSTYRPQTSRHSPPSRTSSKSHDRADSLNFGGKGLTIAEQLYSKGGAASHSIHPTGSGGQISSSYRPETSRHSPHSRTSSNSRDRAGNLNSNGKGLTIAEQLYSKGGAASHLILPTGLGGQVSSSYRPETSRHSPSRTSSSSRDRAGNLNSNGKGLTIAEQLYSKGAAASHLIPPNGSGGRTQKQSHSPNCERGAPTSGGGKSRGRRSGDRPGNYPGSSSGSRRNNNPRTQTDSYEQTINKIDEQLAMLEKKLGAKGGRFGGNSYGNRY